ncbi:hypothetical protein INR49_014049, partial [Caranx melampygus]
MLLIVVSVAREGQVEKCREKSEQEKVEGETDNNPEDISEDTAHLRRGIWEEMRRETPAELLGLA